jgi:hypothetical protein
VVKHGRASSVRFGGDPNLAPNVVPRPDGAGERLGGNGRWGRCGCHEGVVERRAEADLELAIGVAQVDLDRRDRDERRLRDLLAQTGAAFETSQAKLLDQ